MGPIAPSDLKIGFEGQTRRKERKKKGGSSIGQTCLPWGCRTVIPPSVNWRGEKGGEGGKTILFTDEKLAEVRVVTIP